MRHSERTWYSMSLSLASSPLLKLVNCIIVFRKDTFVQDRACQYHILEYTTTSKIRFQLGYSIGGTELTEVTFSCLVGEGGKDVISTFFIESLTCWSEKYYSFFSPWDSFLDQRQQHHKLFSLALGHAYLLSPFLLNFLYQFTSDLGVIKFYMEIKC